MSDSTEITIDPLNVKKLSIGIVGTTPLICHNKEMVAEQLEADREGTSPKDLETDPEQEYRQSLYEMPEHCPSEYGVPSIMFKKAMVRATKATDMAMTDARQAFFVYGTESSDMVALDHPDSEPDMRKDVVRVGRGSNKEVRYRGQFREWSADLIVEFNTSLITAQGVVELLAIAGFCVGIGDWRPQKGGQYGRFEIDTADEENSAMEHAKEVLDQ
jgi:hypothetical protein